MPKHDTANDTQDALHPACEAGFWVIPGSDACRVLVTPGPDGMIAILLDEFADQSPFELLDLCCEYRADFFGGVFFDSLPARTGPDITGVLGRMFVHRDSSYLTCEIDGELVLINIKDAEWKGEPGDCNLALNWNIHAIYSNPYLAVVYERPDAGAGLVW